MPPSKRAKRTSTMDSLATTASASPAAAEPTSASSKLPYLPSKRRQVKIADDADLVLAKCRKLRDALRMKAMMKQSDSDDDGDDDDEWGGKKKKAKTTTTTTAATTATRVVSRQGMRMRRVPNRMAGIGMQKRGISDRISFQRGGQCHSANRLADK
mmetsp:Transcript_28651/g.61648  ORF Transcript_28651/g.61648 Transcript_28651/m.61648 type:complete len:156 (+) Transcript_28651:78-545(+)